MDIFYFNHISTSLPGFQWISSSAIAPNRASALFFRVFLCTTVLHSCRKSHPCFLLFWCPELAKLKKRIPIKNGSSTDRASFVLLFLSWHYFYSCYLTWLVRVLPKSWSWFSLTLSALKLNSFQWSWRVDWRKTRFLTFIFGVSIPQLNFGTTSKLHFQARHFSQAAKRESETYSLGSTVLLQDFL